MSEFGFASWNSQGKRNNYGIKPSMVLGRSSVASFSQSGNWSFTLRAGYVLKYIQAPVENVNTGLRRKFTISGGTITCTAANTTQFETNTEPAIAAVIVFYQEKA
ncbi:hypothetical protein [Pseudocitrobacter faecalis]|uniref:Uncharacterized protein n=1 Tax=Pseudocitrobacter faecalis TaxID=1398493 RepID=A0ABX9FSA1_9ENTR|nr:hypothetical protein DFQ50_1183 [Pseudocitrobacter faecalis]